jgi:hypothetical protein
MRGEEFIDAGDEVVVRVAQEARGDGRGVPVASRRTAEEIRKTPRGLTARQCGIEMALFRAPTGRSLNSSRDRAEAAEFRSFV